jgi:hypothetical protein
MFDLKKLLRKKSIHLSLVPNCIDTRVKKKLINVEALYFEYAREVRDFVLNLILLQWITKPCLLLRKRLRMRLRRIIKPAKYRSGGRSEKTTGIRNAIAQILR